MYIYRYKHTYTHMYLLTSITHINNGENICY